LLLEHNIILIKTIPMKKIFKALKGLFAGKQNLITFDDNLYKTNDDLGYC
jgi:hypothetical protein